MLCVCVCVCVCIVYQCYSVSVNCCVRVTSRMYHIIASE